MDVTKKVLALNGFSSFNPMQEKALKHDLFNQSLVVSAPTAAGKTILAELAALNSVLNRKQKVVYTCPLRALASEHYHDFKKKYAQSLDIRASISTGDFDSSSNYLANYDVIYSTYEKLDSLTRHHAAWLQSIGLLIVDEIHELDSDRGPTLEMVITKLRHLNPKLQVLALSATIPNAKELAAWLEAELVQSDYRPCKLQEGVYFDQAIQFSDDTLEPVASGREPVHALAEDTLAGPGLRQHPQARRGPGQATGRPVRESPFRPRKEASGGPGRAGLERPRAAHRAMPHAPRAAEERSFVPPRRPPAEAT